MTQIVICRRCWNQDEADLELIRRYPEIFPNFYLIPTPHLDRMSLIELREFALMALVQLRWLVCALDQAGDDLLDFFDFNGKPWATPPPMNELPVPPQVGSTCHADSM